MAEVTTVDATAISTPLDSLLIADILLLLVLLQIETLSRVNHKNFVNLIGYCEENEPFSRMMVYEYAPNGTLFEHLHGK